jgi:uncharacterized protein (DUF58 family)
MAKGASKQKSEPSDGWDLAPGEDEPVFADEEDLVTEGGELEDDGDGAEFTKPAVEEPVERRLPESQHAQHMELVDGRRLHPTPRLWILFGLSIVLGAGAIVVAFGMKQTIAAFIAGGIAVLILLLAVIMSLSVRSGAKNAYIDVKREVELPARLRVGDQFSATLDASGCRFGGGVRIRLKETPTPGLTPVEPTKLHNPGVVTYRMCANQRGKQKLRGVDVLITDGFGLWMQERRYKLETEIAVEAGNDALGLRAQIMGKMGFSRETPKAMMYLFRDIELENTHEYGPGDRMKDVDWKRASITGQMIVRERNIESSTHALLLFDCGTSMTMVRPGGKRSIDLALEYAHEIVLKATGRMVAVGYLAFDDRRGIDSMRPSKKKTLDRDLPARFNYFTDPLGHPDEKDPLRKILHEQKLDATMARTLKSGLGPKTSIIVFSDLDTIDEAVIQVVSKAAQGGVKTAVVLLPAPTYRMKRRYRVAGGKRPPHGFRGKKIRKELREVLMAQNVEFLDLRSRLE